MTTQFDPVPEADWIPLCASDALTEGGAGVRFPIMAAGKKTTGFAIRYRQQVFAYVNRCAHVSIELDWNEGEFFDSSRSLLICSTHGAMYRPDGGQCMGGPCRGGRLLPIAVMERDQQVFWQPGEHACAVADSSDTSNIPAN